MTTLQHEALDWLAGQKNVRRGPTVVTDSLRVFAVEWTCGAGTFRRYLYPDGSRMRDVRLGGQVF